MLKRVISSKCCPLSVVCADIFADVHFIYAVFTLLPSSCEDGCNGNNKRDSPEPRLCLKVIVIKVVLILRY